MESKELTKKVIYKGKVQEDTDEHGHTRYGSRKSRFINYDGATRLYVSIWKKAVEDDTAKTKARLFFDTTEALFPALLNYARENRTSHQQAEHIIHEHYGKGGVKVFHRLEEKMKESDELVISEIREKILREENEWPQNTKAKDNEFENTYYKIRESVLTGFSEVMYNG